MARKQPTPRQLTAYSYTYILGLTNAEAAVRMNLTNESSVRKLLIRFFEVRPDLKPSITRKNSKVLSYCKQMDNMITTKF